MHRRVNHVSPKAFLLVGSLTIAATMHAYEQGTYMIFDIVDTVSIETTGLPQIQIEKSLFSQEIETASTEATQLETTSDFIVDFTNSDTTSSAFTDEVATQNFSTLDLTATEQTTVFGTGATSVFDQ